VTHDESTEPTLTAEATARAKPGNARCDRVFLLFHYATLCAQDLYSLCTGRPTSGSSKGSPARFKNPWRLETTRRVELAPGIGNLAVTMRWG